MTDVLFVAAFLLLPLFGLWTWRLEAVRRMDLAGRIAVAGAAGALSTAVVMALFSLLHVHWAAVWIAAVQLPLVNPGVIARRGGRRGWNWAIVAFIALTCYGTLTARESAGDLHFFWGPKAIHFANARGIDVAFLANRVHPNPDYPPLVPLVYAWCTLVAGSFSWWGGVFSAALCLAGCVAIVRAWSGDELGALLLAATLAWTFAIGYSAGGADPPLVFFETLTLAALTFLDDSNGVLRASSHAPGGAPEARTTPDILAAIGLAGAAFTKVEGATFVIAVVIAMIVVRRNLKRALAIAAPAIVLLVSWLAFLVVNHLVFGYGGAKTAIHLGVLPLTLSLLASSAQYGLYGLPWIAPIALLAMRGGQAILPVRTGRIASPPPRRAALPLLVALLTIGAAIFFYIHSGDPSWWIPASALRVLLTPLTALIIACVEAQRVEERP